MKRRTERVFESVLYAQCWEDPSLDREAFRIKPGDTVFSITSGGCNALAFLLDNPERVIALDLNPSQNYLLELKMAGFARLSYGELLAFLGVRPCLDRKGLYSLLRERLSPACREFWDRRPDQIADGILHCGRYEQYMKLLRTWLRRCMGEALIRRFFELDDASDRHSLFHAKWENVWWWLFTRILLSKTTMSALFTKDFFQYLDHSFSFGRHFATRVEHALTTLPTKENYFLSYILLGRYYDEAHLPPYLRPENFDAVRNRIHRITIVTGSCQEYFAALPSNTITQFNFTNIFEWMSREQYEQLLRDTIRVARDGAVLTYRNLLVFRERPSCLSSQILSHGDHARRLHHRDLSFIYSNYVIETVKKETRTWSTSPSVSAIAAQ